MVNKSAASQALDEDDADNTQLKMAGSFYSAAIFIWSWKKSKYHKSKSKHVREDNV